MRTKPCPKCSGTGVIPDDSAVGAAYRAKRIHAGISLREAAGLLDISPPFLSDMELGKRRFAEHYQEEILRIIKDKNAT